MALFSMEKIISDSVANEYERLNEVLGMMLPEENLMEKFDAAFVVFGWLSNAA